MQSNRVKRCLLYTSAYLKAKEKYDMQREKLAGRYKTKTATVSYTHLDVYKRQEDTNIADISPKIFTISSKFTESI